MSTRGVITVVLICALTACGGQSDQKTASSSNDKPVTIALQMMDPNAAYTAKLLARTPAGAVVAPYQDSSDTVGLGNALLDSHLATKKYELNWGNHYFTRIVAPANSPDVTCTPLNYGSLCKIVVGRMSLANQGTEQYYGQSAPAFDCTLTLTPLGRKLHLPPSNAIAPNGWQHTGDAPHMFIVGQKYRCVVPQGNDGNPQFPS